MSAISEQLGINATVLASIIQLIILTCFFVIPAGVALYFLIRLAVRHGLKDGQKDSAKGKKTN